MDSEQLRATLRALNPRTCPFEKAILTHFCDCSQAERFCIAERSGVQCRSETARDRCIRLLGLLREQARFALRQLDQESALSSAKGMRLQVGGLRGLVQILGSDQSDLHTLGDVHRLLQDLEQGYPALAGLPFGPIMREIAAFRSRVTLRKREPPRLR